MKHLVVLALAVATGAAVSGAVYLSTVKEDQRDRACRDHGGMLVPGREGFGCVQGQLRRPLWGP